MTCALRVARASADVMCVNDILSISFMSSTVNWDFGWAGAGVAGVAEEGAEEGEGEGNVGNVGKVGMVYSSGIDGEVGVDSS